MADLLNSLRNADETLTGLFDHAFAPVNNPWRHLGALAFLCLVVVVVSGVVAFVLYDTSVAGAYESGRRLQNDPLLLGRLLRGMHRYAADACMLLSLLHLIREAARGHYRGVRWFSWLSGLPLLGLLWIAGLTGFWLLWDERALFSVTATAQWLQALPVFADGLARNFLTAQALTDRFFSLVVFMHIGVPLFLLAGVWIHVQRISHAKIWPPRSVTVCTLALFAVVALGVPAESLGPADPGWMPASLSLDWFYLVAHPVVDVLSASGAWWLLLATSLVLGLLPFVARVPLVPGSTQGAQRLSAVVDLDNCNGCARCVADCPFGAVVMVPRTDQLHHRQQAFVINDLCASCGICVGACPSSTPFRRLQDIVSGIELPQRRVLDLRQQLQTGLAALKGPTKVMLFGCEQAALWNDLADGSTAVVTLTCAAMLPPSFIEYALRLGADGVVIAGCRAGDCEFRLGDAWLQERLAGLREPRLRASVPHDRLVVVWAGNQRDQVIAAIDELRLHHQKIPTTPHDATIKAHHEPNFRV